MWTPLSRGQDNRLAPHLLAGEFKVHPPGQNKGVANPKSRGVAKKRSSVALQLVKNCANRKTKKKKKS